MQNNDVATLLSNKKAIKGRKRLAGVFKNYYTPSYMEESEVYSLMGAYKNSYKREYTYMEIDSEIDNVNMKYIEENWEERMREKYQSDKWQPVKLEEVSNNNIDWRQGNFYSLRYQYGCFALFLTSFLNFASAIIYYEYDYSLLFYNNSLKHQNETVFINSQATLPKIYSFRNTTDSMRQIWENGSETALLSVFICSILTEITTAMMHAEYIDWKKSIRLLPQEETFVKSKEFKNYVIQALITFVQPLYLLNNVIVNVLINDKEYTIVKLNYFFLTIYLPTRFFNMIKFFIVSSYFYSTRAQRFANMYGTEVSDSFALKCILKSKPLICLVILFCSNIFLGGYLIRIWERLGEKCPSEGFDSYQNCIWYAFITMCTVGYGDLFAKSIMGRIITTIVAILGVFICSTLTVIMTDNFTFKGGELKAFNMLNQIEMNEQLDFIRKRMLTQCMISFHNIRKKQRNINNPKLVNRYEKVINSLVMQRDNLKKQIKDVKYFIKNTFKAEPLDIIVDKMADVRKSVKCIQETIETFQDIIERNEENNRKLEALKNTIVAAGGY